VPLDGNSLDPDDPPDSLASHWSVLQHRNQFVSSVLQADAADTAFIATATGEGSNTLYYEARLIVTDPQGLTSDALARMFPNCDLRPGAVSVTPAQPVSGGSATWSLRVYNDGRMRTRPVRWRLTLAGATIAEGDTVVQALDSVLVTRTLPVTPTAGTYELRASLDTLGLVVEAEQKPATEPRGRSPSPAAQHRGRITCRAPHPLGGRPNPARGAVVALELPSAQPCWSVLDIQESRVVVGPPGPHRGGTHHLRWEGATRGNPLPPGST
jgi:hypothetical protein